MITFHLGFENSFMLQIPFYITYFILVACVILIFKIFRPQSFYRLLGYIKINFRTFWFFSSFIVILLYCISNWSEVIKLTPLTANPFILAFLGVLLILPYIKKLDVLGVRTELNDLFLVRNSEESLSRMELQQTSSDGQIEQSVLQQQEQFRQQLEQQQNQRGVSNRD